MKSYTKLIITIGTIGISFILNLILFQWMQLEQPVFLKHYYEIQLEEAAGFNLYCIMNKGDTKEVVKLEFPELEGDGHHFKVNKGNQFSLSSHHDKKEYWIEYRYTGGDKPIQEEVSLTEAKVMFSNGEKLNIPIGQIVFYPAQNASEERHILKYTSSSSSSSGEMTSNAIFTEDAELLEVKSTLDPLVEDLIDIRINGSMPSERSFKKDMQWRLEGKLEVGKDDPRRFDAYEVQKRVYFRKAQGEIVMERILNLRHNPYFSKIESYQYLKQVGGIK